MKKNANDTKRSLEAVPLDQLSKDDYVGATSGVLKGDTRPSKVVVGVPHDSDKTDTVYDVSTSAVPAKSGNGSLWDQFSKTHKVSTRKESSSLTLAGSSDEDEVSMPEVMRSFFG